jgi:RNA polymerase sigma-70 factor (ECF subfamily)
MTKVFIIIGIALGALLIAGVVLSLVAPKRISVTNKLLQIDYSPMAALNRTYALAKARDYETAIREAEKLDLEESHWYHALLGELYTVIDQQKAHAYFQKAIALSKTVADRSVLQKKKNQMEVTLASEPVKKHNTQ